MCMYQIPMMKRLVYVFPLVALLTACLLLGGCSDNSRAIALLSRADSLMADRPDSALQILDGCETEVAAWPESQQMRHRLLQAKGRNKAYVPFTSDSVMTIVVDYYDCHGTANEQMEAHYLLGCVYRDLGEAPKALSAYHDAVECADTLSVSCDFRTLMSIYGQMAELYHKQNLPVDEILSRRMCSRYASILNDTLISIRAYELLLKPYFLLGDTDKVIEIIDSARQMYFNIGCRQQANDGCCTLAHIYLKRGQLGKAKEMLSLFEARAGLIDIYGNISPGREIYYYVKGNYYVSTHKYDSAEYYFRKELATGRDFNNQNAGARGLALLFQQTYKLDSAAKYALYSYAVNDSVYAHEAISEVARMKSLYDYNRYERIANEKTLKAERFKFSLIMVCALAVILLLLVVLIYIRHQNEKRRLEDRIRLLRGYATNEQLHDAPIAHQFRQLLKENPYKMPDLNDWKALSSLIDQEVPAFRTTLNGGSHTLTDFEYDVCMLIKIQIPASDIAKLKQCAPSYITQTRKNIFQNLFSKKGRADELDEYIMSLS